MTDDATLLPLEPAEAAGAAVVELSVIVPSFNERDNIAPLIAKLAECLGGIAWEVIYVDDDSADGTAAAVKAIARRDPRVRCIHRIGRRGLSTAVIEGIQASSAPYVAVIDADLQHDETVLPKMLEALKTGEFDIVVGSRYVAGGDVGDWDRNRVAISGLATTLSRLVVSAKLTDPMSGFFMVTRAAFDRAVRQLSGQGFNILLDLFASSPTPYRFKELPYTFRSRIHGESKLDTLVAWEYLMLLCDKLFGRFVPVRFVLFGAVGASGVVVFLVALRIAISVAGHVFASPQDAFEAAQAAATIVAMTSNFALNNLLTYRDKRLRGKRFFSGLASFYAVCAIGAVANVGIAAAAFRENYSWWLAGLAGTAVGVVWNYAVSSIFTWR